MSFLYLVKNLAKMSEGRWSEGERRRMSVVKGIRLAEGIIPS